MNVKIGNSIIIGDIKQINFDDLKLGDQITLFEEKYIDEIDLNFNNIKNMIMTDNFINMLYSFNVNETSPIIHIEDCGNFKEEEWNNILTKDKDEIIDKLVDEFDFESKNYYDGYLKLNNNIIKLKNINNETFYKRNINDLVKFTKDIDNCKYKNNDYFIKELYNECLYILNNKNKTKINRINQEQGSTIQSLFVPIDNNNCHTYTALFFIIKNNITDNNLISTSKSVLLMDDNGNFVDITTFISSFEDIYNLIRNDDPNFHTFDRLLQISKYDIHDYIKNNKILEEITSEFCTQFDINKSKIKEIFKPLYQDKCNDIEVFRNTIKKEHSVKVKIYQHKKEISSYILEYEKDKLDINVLNAYKIGKSILHFNIYNYNIPKLNPKNGKIYYKNKKYNNEDARILYKDNSTIIVKNVIKTLYFYKLNDYFINVDYIDNEDKRNKLINEIKDRKKLLDTLNKDNEEIS